MIGISYAEHEAWQRLTTAPNLLGVVAYFVLLGIGFAYVKTMADNGDSEYCSMYSKTSECKMEMARTQSLLLHSCRCTSKAGCPRRNFPFEGNTWMISMR
jgi:hypothetical protein